LEAACNEYYKMVFYNSLNTFPSDIS